MESIIVSNSPHKGKCFSRLETSVNLSPSDTSLKALASCCLFGKVVAPMVVEEINVTDFVAKNWKMQVSVVALVDEEKTSNVFKFGFECVEHRNWALDNGPWCVPNGNLLGELAGKVVQVELEEDRLASWRKFLKVQVDIEVEKPLFSGCFFDLASEVKRWVQVKYEKIGIFCYFCGCLGHQRRGCSLTSPVTVANKDGIPFPMFRLWLSIQSVYQNVFSGPISSDTRRFVSSDGRNDGGVLLSLPAILGNDDDGSKGTLPSSSRRPRRPVIGTTRASADLGKTQRVVWFPKNRPLGVEKAVSKSDYGGATERLDKRKTSEVLPVLNLNSLDSESLKDKNFKSLPVMDSGPCVTGPNGNSIVKAGIIKAIGNGPTNKKLGNGLPMITSSAQMGGPMVDSNFKRGSVGPCLLGSCSNPIGPESLAKEKSELVGVNTSLPNISHGAPVLVNEEQALAQFFNAQEELLHDLKHFGKLDLYEIRNIGGDIGVPASSEVNERTTPFKKRKFEASASLCSRPHKVPCKYLDVVRDFPWDTKNKVNDLKLEIDDPSEDSSSSPSCSVF
ncbi:hypothetical protein G4B88_021030 [Cannabis sativa]|uniref:Zinc knuckle CX2CX4HX4C domain-containing protein n=1 Tax=Cannabis sativa TaxID=3483 RepID=A0A7J6HXC7_CANSA|nr:hypothetical protein G4B88_021030 [Cannabis sativa]